MKKILFLILLFSNSFLVLADEEILNFIKKYHSYDTLYLVDGQVNKDDLNATHLEKITYLSCSGDFTTLPKNINLLKSLINLNLSNSSLQELRDEVFELSELYFLTINNTLLKFIPRGIGKLTKLNILDLSFNSIEELPSEINTLTNLTTLYLNNNRLKKLPNIENLTNLKEVYLNHNNLVEVPKGIENICSSFDNYFRGAPPLRPCILDISNNRLSYLPKEIANIEGFGCGYIEDSNISLKILNNFYTKIPNSFKDIKFKTKFSDGRIYDCSADTTQLGYEFFDLDIAYNFETNKSLLFKPILGDELEVTSYLWLFGDDTNSTENNPTHTYEEFGEYNVTLILNHNLSNKKEYVASKTINIYPRVKEFKKGWNLITAPTTNDINAKLFSEVWSYDAYRWSSDNEFLIPTKGYWVKSESDFDISFNGNSYPLFDSKIKPDWNLVGIGKNMTTFDKSLIYYTYRDNSWIKNPKEINAGEGVWINEPLNDKEKLVNFINSVNAKVNGKEQQITITDLSGIYQLEFFYLDYLPSGIKHLTNLQNLIISQSNIEELPKELFNLKELTSLNIGNSKLKEVPKEIANLINLEKLFLSGNELKELPTEIENLTKLKTIFLIGNNFTTIGNISKLTNLTHLTLSSNEIKEFKGIKELINLTDLGLVNNNLKELPAEIGELINLKNLDLSSNLLETIPYEISNLINLKNLRLTSNRFKELPIELTNIPNLERLYINRNEISKIPPEIKNLQKLEYLELSDNPIKEFPEEIKNMPNLNLIEK